MGEAARQEFERKYSAERNYSQLIALYRRLVEQKASATQTATAFASNSMSAGGAS
jgi:hypothetical protein